MLVGKGGGESMKVHCQVIRPLLGQFYDGELSASQSDAVDGHLRNCSGCAAEMAGIQQLGESVRLRVLPEPPEDLWDRIERELPPARLPAEVVSRRRFFWVQVVTVAALLVIAVGTGWLAYLSPSAAGRARSADGVDLADYLDSGVPQTFVGTQPVSLNLSDLEMDMCPARFAVAHATHLPGGFAAQKSLMGRCGGQQLVQTEYRQGDDRVVVLQYPVGAPVRVSREQVERVQVAGRNVSVVPGARCWAATWQSDQTVIVVLGPADRDALLKIVATVDGRFTKERS